jgi:hypothetical protein
MKSAGARIETDLFIDRHFRLAMTGQEERERERQKPRLEENSNPKISRW